MAINKLNRQNWSNITIHKIKLEDAQNRIDFNRRLRAVRYPNNCCGNFYMAKDSNRPKRIRGSR